MYKEKQISYVIGTHFNGGGRYAYFSADFNVHSICNHSSMWRRLFRDCSYRKNSGLSSSFVCDVMVIYTAGTSYNCNYCFDYNCSMLLFKVMEIDNNIIVYQY